MSVLISSLYENLIAHALNVATSHEIWIILEELFSTKSQVCIMQVQYQLTTLKKGLDSIPNYLQKAKLLHDTLATASKTLPPFEYITFLLVGLGSHFD